MRALVLTLLGAMVLSGADEAQLALLLKAQTDFTRVMLSATPTFPETSACVASEAALLPVSGPAEIPLVHYRRGYCMLIGAAITHREVLFDGAEADFQKTIETWPARVALQPKKAAPEAAPSALPVLSAVAHLLKSPGDPVVRASAQQQIRDALAVSACPGSVMAPEACRADLALGRKWLGWIELTGGDLAKAAQDFSAFADSGWPAWVAGRQAFQAANYSESAKDYRSAVESWQHAAPELLAPRPDLGAAMTELGGALVASGDAPGAIAVLDSAIKTEPLQARAYYYRARAKELAGQPDAALSDYSLASRTAFAASRDLASGEAHLYRGIAAYRRKEFSRAEDEFSNALNFSIPEALRGDAAAWRRLAAVSTGACGNSAELLARDLRTVSPFFPKTEASARVNACARTSSQN